MCATFCSRSTLISLSYSIGPVRNHIQLHVCVYVQNVTRGNVAPHFSNETTEVRVFEARSAAGVEPCVNL